jgi:hypothetical protein
MVEKTGNETEMDKVMAMDAWQLLTYALENPEYLSDPYYSLIGNAINARYEQLENERG